MPREVGAIAVFAEPSHAAEAIRALRAARHADIRVAAPAPYPAVIEALGRPRSRLDHVTLSGASIGVTAGFALCIGTAVAWPLMTGGKPIVSIPPFVIIAFEVAVLIGATVNLFALLVSAFRARRRRPVPHDPRFSADRVGVYVVGGDVAGAESILRAHGAEEVRRVA
jgi:Alternative complex III, ActD subunit